MVFSQAMLKVLVLKLWVEYELKVEFDHVESDADAVNVLERLWTRTKYAWGQEGKAARTIGNTYANRDHVCPDALGSTRRFCTTCAFLWCPYGNSKHFEEDGGCYSCFMGDKVAPLEEEEGHDAVGH